MDIGNQMLLTFHSATTLGNNATTFARLIVEQGGMVTLSNNSTSFGQTIYSLSDGGGAGGMITNLATTSGTATLTISGNDTKTFSGTIVDGANAGTGLPGVNGVVAVTKGGNGTQIFSGANTYTGNTTINAGTLLINNTTGSGAVIVNSGGTLGGNGTIAGSVTINAGGTLSPGNSPGLLTVNGPLSLAGNTNMEIATGTRGTNYDAVDVGLSQPLTYGGTLTLTMTGAISNGTYSLFSFTSGSNTGNFSSIAFAGGFYSGTWNRSVDLWTSSLTQGQVFTFNQANGELAAIPEPATWALLAFTMTTVLVFRRRRC